MASRDSRSRNGEGPREPQERAGATAVSVADRSEQLACLRSIAGLECRMGRLGRRRLNIDTIMGYESRARCSWSASDAKAMIDRVNVYRVHV